LSPAGFTFSLSEPATVTVRIQRRLNSAPRSRCPATRVKGAAGRYADAATVTVPAAGGAGTAAVGPGGEKVAAGAARAHRVRTKLRRHARAGRSKVSLAQVAGEEALAPGTYIARASAITTDGRAAPEAVVKFWVLDRRR
jgi:hypothetical protein